MANGVVKKGSAIAQGGSASKKGPSERRVPFDTLEAWLIVASDRSKDAHERLGWLQSAIAWTLGKDSKIATDIMTRQFQGDNNDKK